jgi:signal transduction histidine kinase
VGILFLVANSCQLFLISLVNKIELKDFNNCAEITIKDAGVGFNEQEKEKLFKRFGKIERYGKGMLVDTEGPGLGLYLSKEIIHLHGGEISLKSEGRNKGSSFTIRLYKNENKN